jgi:hypothetical protein
MAKAKRGSIRKRGKAALAVGAAGVSLAMTGGASATAPATAPSQGDARRFILAEEEISDVSLATFHVFDRENPPLSQNIRVAAHGCGGCGCGGCAHAGCAAALMPSAALVAPAPPLASAALLASASIVLLASIALLAAVAVAPVEVALEAALAVAFG